jgi:hypothetical protein
MSHSNRPPAVRKNSSRVQKVVHFEPFYFDLPWYTFTDRRHALRFLARGDIAIAPDVSVDHFSHEDSFIIKQQ